MHILQQSEKYKQYLHIYGNVLIKILLICSIFLVCFIRGIYVMLLNKKKYEWNFKGKILVKDLLRKYKLINFPYKWLIFYR